MMAFWRRFMQWWRGLTLWIPARARVGHPDDVSLVGAPAPLPVAPVEPSARVARRPRVPRLGPEEPGSCRWHFRDQILDRLDEYFTCLPRLRRHDPGAYALFAKTGLAIPADVFINPHRVLPPEHEMKRVAFGGIQCALDEKNRNPARVYPSFFYFKKLRRPIGVEAHRGDVYELVYFFDDRIPTRRWRSKLSCPACIYVGVAPDGALRALKVLHTSTSRVQPSAARGKHKPAPVTVQRRTWDYPAPLLDMVEEYRDEPRWGGTPLTPHIFAAEALYMALATYSDVINRIVVQVRHQGVRAAFGIDLPRAKYFFADRDATALTPTGQRKRIFHAVVQHERVVSATRTTTVREHYRGSRDFTWQGYGIHIVLPSRRYALEFPVPARELDTMTPSERRTSVDERQMGEILDGVLST